MREQRCVCEREREGGDRQTHRDTHRQLVTVPLQVPVPVPEMVACLSILYTPSLGDTRKIPRHFVTSSFGLQVVPRKSSDVWWFLFLEKVPRVTTLKTGSRPRQGSQWHGAVPQTQIHPTTGSESTHQGLSGKASGAAATSLGLRCSSPRTRPWRGSAEECQPCDSAVTPQPCDGAVSCDCGQPVSSGTPAASEGEEKRLHTLPSAASGARGFYKCELAWVLLVSRIPV